MKIKTAIIQFNITERQIDTNMHKAEELLTAAAQEQVDLLILPEMWNKHILRHLVPNFLHTGKTNHRTS